MSVQNALRFIAALRAEPALVEQMRVLGAVPGIDRVVRIGADRGFEFSAAELREAYLHDWNMRRAHYSPPKASERD